MEPELNPYRPGAGLLPPELAGREEHLNHFEQLIIRAKHRTIDRALIISGLRGVGKTALMTRFSQMADQHRWIYITTEGQANDTAAHEVRRRLGAEIQAALVRFSLKARLDDALRHLSALAGQFSLSLGPVTIESKPAATGLLDLDVETLTLAIAKEAQVREAAFAIFVDELQDLDHDMLTALLVAQHKAQQQNLPFYLIGAGLPSLPAILTNAKSYAERLFRYSTVGPLNEQHATEALTVPAEKVGCSYSPDALATILTASGGYPYFLQEYGKAIWDFADEKTFTDLDALAAVEIGREQLDSGFFPSRWLRASDREREYMTTMSVVGAGKPASTTAIAKDMSAAPSKLSPIRQSLIAKGLIYAPERGFVDFSVPGMADYIDRAWIGD
ncbi:AAA family ATPase [Propionicimonas sp.]|jgi:hypothetical protein|uniref:AAA family ATPase n=1 Tax=Propionicimonas sp. TaxID=1955623 RepID=UPI00181D1F40|nr:ATP-binding protein [Propionicimonas sp.]MBA3019645.1 ATP-binding protein [Propionicimonas sp.]MBU4208010.1 ATP-binding protein [Actinomycetota bacterium]MBU4411452.1 ATP-binding protein [Actinomycetota bacterium]MCG2805764.1 ATP-binding protein [Propionicimonas sp.]